MFCRCQAEIEELKMKLALAELEQDRLQEETRDVQQQLAESKQILLESEIEQNRLADEKDEVETKLIDLTKVRFFTTTKLILGFLDSHALHNH